jgi:N-acetylneuraminic acid mutarotase
MRVLLLALLLMMVGCAGLRHETPFVMVPPPLPERAGLAGMYAGVSSGALLAAGGANFPENMPWEGGRKVWHDAVYVLDRPDGEWRVAGRLPRPLGYGVSVTYGDAVICAGGSNAAGHYADVFRLRWTREGLKTEALPAFPKPVANGCGAVVGSTLYVIGGQSSAEGPSSDEVFSMDLSVREPMWSKVESLPPAAGGGGGRILAVAAVCDGSLYVAGGATRTTGADGKQVRRYLADAYRYDPRRGWSRVADLPHAVVAAPSPAPSENGAWYVLGGDDGTQVGVTPGAHRGFSRGVLRYDARAGRWTEVAEKLSVGQVTAPCVGWEGMWRVVSGEVRPGVRSPAVLSWRPAEKE